MRHSRTQVCVDGVPVFRSFNIFENLVMIVSSPVNDNKLQHDF